MRVYVNGENKEFSEERLSLEQFVTELDLSARRLAIEVNGQIVRRSDWSSTLVKDGDTVEIVHFVGGGSCSQRIECRVRTVK